MNTIDSIREYMVKEDGIKAFDMAVSAYVSPDATEYQRNKIYKKAICQSLLLVAGYEWADVSNLPNVVNECLSMLAKSENVIATKEVGACLFLLLQYPSISWIDDSTWRVKIIAFLKNAFDASFFEQDWKIDFSKMGHVTISNIRRSVQDVIKDLHNSLGKLTSLSQLDTHRKSMMQTINRRSGRYVFVPFFPPNFSSELNELYRRAGKYRENTSSDILRAYREFQEQAEKVSNSLAAYGTSYSILVKERLVDKLAMLIRKDIQSNEAAQPANVIVEPIAKRYPFHTIDNEVNVGLVVRNDGPGYSGETQLEIISDDILDINSEVSKIDIGRLAPGIVQGIDIAAKVKQVASESTILVGWSWVNFDGARGKRDVEIQLVAQKDDTDWNALAQSEPYSLEPVETKQHLIGRQEIFNRLIGIFGATKIGSAVIKGQKRVGKTSIAKSFASELKQKGYTVIYLEGGDYVDPSPQKTIERLGKRLCRRLGRLEPRLKNIPVPEFSDSLSPMAEYLDDVIEQVPDIRMVVILDEFDELPIELYEKNKIGNSFFLTLRSLSSRHELGFLLVGGEKMNHILSFQGAQLNKWATIAVDYFRRDRDWEDFIELVERPVVGSLEYIPDAHNQIFEITSGNPYFTNLICGYIFREAVKNRDCYITKKEVDSAVEIAVNELSANTFQHFWDDGIIETGENATERLVERRKILLAIANLLEFDPPVTLEKMEKSKVVSGLPSVSKIIQEFVTRGVVTIDAKTNTYQFKVPLFSVWMRRKGVNELLSTFDLLNAELREIEKEERYRIRSEEILGVVNRWGIYRGQRITSDHVRLWLEQFGKPSKQRLMFAILQHLHFYSNSAIRNKLKELDTVVRSGLGRTIKSGQRKRADILVSFYDHMGKSGARFANLYADVAGIYVKNIVPKSEIMNRIEEDDEIKAIVFLDDFVGTGESAIGYLHQIDDILHSTEMKRRSELKIVFSAVVAFRDGWSKLETEVDNLRSNIILHYCEMLDSSDKVFSRNAGIYNTDDEREEAKKIAFDKGKNLVKKWPLGYGDLELAIVFEHSCPNNSLPILWSESSNWIPLFKRH